MSVDTGDEGGDRLDCISRKQARQGKLSYRSGGPLGVSASLAKLFKGGKRRKE